MVSTGLFGDEPHRTFIEADPWGESPLADLVGERWTFVECRACRQRFHRRILSPEWDEIRFSKWMTADAIHEFETRCVSGDVIMREFSLATAHVAHALRIEEQSHRKIHLPDHINAFTPSTLASIAQRTGFTPIRRSCAHVTTDLTRVARTEARNLLGRDDRSTRRYFQKSF